MALCALGLALASGFAVAEGIAVRGASLEQTEAGWQVEANFDIQFSSRLEEAVNRGVPLYLVVDFEISRPRRMTIPSSSK